VYHEILLATCFPSCVLANGDVGGHDVDRNAISIHVTYDVDMTIRLIALC
jgi:hypothetical protein